MILCISAHTLPSNEVRFVLLPNDLKFFSFQSVLALGVGR